ncbi:MAG: hypothetical protein HGB12_14025 [Bacteroidetes bacterium]|nr:hypothetical protein [Bacteroidota bacterium]
MTVSIKSLAEHIFQKEKTRQHKELLDLQIALVRKFARGNISLQDGNFVTKADKIKRIEKLAARKRT